ncbi:DUF305 domain-containing protein [Synechococcus moorigangaii CMS01]|nr:DUF305 domain-containing protein [Synechococcus moorigangaii CMS01]
MLLLGVVSFGFVACNRNPVNSGAESGEVSVSMEQDAMQHHDMAAMDLGPGDEFFDLRFIDGMILHHQGAIAMAETALETSAREEIQTLAQEIIAAQEIEIAQMQRWRQAWYPNADETPVMYHADANHMMPMSEAMQAEMRMDVNLGPADSQFDLRFLGAMIPHHEGAVIMAQQVLEQSDRPELLALAEEILTTQQSEIDQMRQWQQDWYGVDQAN